MSSIISDLNWYDKYTDLSDNVRQVIQDNIFKFNPNDIVDTPEYDEYMEDSLHYIRSKYVDPITNLSGELQKEFSEMIDIWLLDSLSSNEIQNKITDRIKYIGDTYGE